MRRHPQDPLSHPAGPEAVSANGAAKRILGILAGELVGLAAEDPRLRTVRQDESPLEVEDRPAAIALRAGKGSDKVIMGLGPKDRRTWIEERVTPLFRPGEKQPYAAYAIFEDITGRLFAESQQNTLQSELNHLQRMEAVGRLAGGIAHDMNNVLAAVMGAASVLQIRRERNQEEEEEEPDLILQACRRGRDLVKGLMEFSRKEIKAAEAIDLNDLVRKEERILTNTTLQRVAIRLDLQEDLPMVTGSSSALSTALMNLCVKCPFRRRA